MIPDRRPSNQYVGVPLRQRVTACRKRLRVSRQLPKLPESSETLGLTAVTGGTFLEESDGVRESGVKAIGSSEFREGETQPIGQEVGIA